MKMIKPIVNISKIMDSYDVIVCGFNGVIYDGEQFDKEAIDALIRLKKNDKKIVLLTNSAWRISQIVEIFYAAGISPKLFNAIVSAGEILHHQLKAGAAQFSALGKIYHNLGSTKDEAVFQGLNYTPVITPSRADFLYVGELPNNSTVESYMELLTHCASLNIPMLCVGRDSSWFVKGEPAIASGAIAEQYTVLGGNIITIGKPSIRLLNYAIEACVNEDKNRVLVVGDSVATDIKGANMASISSLLISKGIHSTYLGDGYIPDVTKTRELANTLNAFPDYVMSSLRW